MKVNELEAWKFNERTEHERPDIDEDIINFLKSKYQRGCIFGLDNLQKAGIYKLHGWVITFRPFLKLYVVKQYDTWQEYYAPNKTMLRKSIYGKIQKIVVVN